MKKRFISVFIVLMICFALIPFSLREVIADSPSGGCGPNLHWELNTSTGTLTITGSGAMYDYNRAYKWTWDKYRDQITTVILPNGLTTIGGCAFEDCNWLTLITIPNSVTNIGEYAFNGCKRMKSATIGDGVKVISERAFSYCERLESVTLGKNITDIEKSAFSSCGYLQDVYYKGTQQMRDSIDFWSLNNDLVFATWHYLPTITTQPKSETVTIGKNATFTVTASEEDVTYQWQYSKNNGSGWTNWSGKTSASVTVKGSETNNGCLYRCVIKNGCGSVTSSKARLTVSDAKPAILTQPTSQTIAVGETVAFKVVAAGKGLTYQWQWSKDGTTWTNCKSNGCNSASLSFSVTAGLNGRQYRCVVENSIGSVTSDGAQLTVSGVKPTILTQPNSATVAVGKSVTFKVVAAGTGLTYQWQYSKDNGATWTKWSGKTSASITVKGSATNCGCLYRCVVKNESGSVISSKVQLTVTGVKPVILTPPTAQTVAVGETVTFKIVAAGEGLTYQWQWSKDGKTWTNCKSTGYNKATFSFKATASLSGRQYRCVVKNSSGTVNSAAAKLIVN